MEFEQYPPPRKLVNRQRRTQCQGVDVLAHGIAESRKILGGAKTSSRIDINDEAVKEAVDGLLRLAKVRDKVAPQRALAPSLFGCSDDVLLHPSTTWVLVVGICNEWPEERNVVGDFALRRAFLDYSVPCDHVEFVCDDDATATNVQGRLVRMLKRIDEGSSFVLYYGGHGAPFNFCTRSGRGIDVPKVQNYWSHADVVDAIERYSPRGVTAWILADCCHAGTFRSAVTEYNNHRHEVRDGQCAKDDVEQPSTLTKAADRRRVSYFCIFSSQANDTAGGEWTFTEFWIRAMSGYYGLLSANDLIGLLSDEIARVKGDRMDAYLHNGYDAVESHSHYDARDTHSLMVQPVFLLEGLHQRILPSVSQQSPHKCVTSSPTFTRHPSRCFSRKSFRENSSFLPTPFRPQLSWGKVPTCTIGDKVNARWCGGYVVRKEGEFEFLPSLWFPATVVSMDSSSKGKGSCNDGDGKSTVRVRMHHHSISLTWIADVDPNWDLLDEYYFANHAALRDALSALAVNNKFISLSPPSGTRVRVLWMDGRKHNATVMSISDVPWEDVADKEEEETRAATDAPREHAGNSRGNRIRNSGLRKYNYERVQGAYVPVQWEEDGTYSLVSARYCYLVHSSSDDGQGSGSGSRSPSRSDSDAGKRWSMCQEKENMS